MVFHYQLAFLANEGINAWVHLDEPEMVILEHDTKLLIYVSTNLRPCSLYCFQPILIFQFFKTLKTHSLFCFQKHIFENKEKIYKENSK